MTNPGPAPYKVMKHADKLDSLKSFIATAAARLEISSDLPRIAPTLIARSPESPAAQALLSAPAAIFKFGAPRIIFTRLANTACVPDLPDAMSLSINRQFRLLDDPRILDAHEQLVLGTDCAWIGDCMRRDPMKRDAFEKFADGCGITTAFAMKSFERLWSVARPIGSELLSRSMPQWSKATDGADSLASTVVSGGDAERTAVTASTRH